MKLLIPGIYCLLVMAAIHAQSPASQTDVINQPFQWKGQAINLLDQVPGTHEVGDNFQGQPDKLSIYRTFFQPQNLGPGTYVLRTLDSSVVSHITFRHYAITGHLIYQNVAAGSFLEMESWFAPEQPGGPELFYFSRTLADAGPMAKIEGSDAGHDFELPFDWTGAKTPLVRLVLKLHLAGSGHLEFTNVKLVQYPDAVGAGSAPSLTVTNSSRMLDWISFLMGIATSVLFLAVIGASSFLLRRLRSRAKERELRRIASLDG